MQLETFIPALNSTRVSSYCCFAKFIKLASINEYIYIILKSTYDPREREKKIKINLFPKLLQHIVECINYARARNEMRNSFDKKGKNTTLHRR